MSKRPSVKRTASVNGTAPLAGTDQGQQTSTPQPNYLYIVLAIAFLFLAIYIAWPIPTPTTSGPREEEHCDFVIVGAGTGGVALASRLAENRDWTVCVLERGPIESGNWTSWKKGTGQYEFISPNDPNAFSTPQLTDRTKYGSGRLIYTPRFHGIGGTSRIYGAIVRRPSPGILAQWPPGWDMDTMTPYYKKLEDHFCHYESENLTGISPADCEKYHGKGGPMPVNVLYEPWFMEFSKNFKQFCGETDSMWGGHTSDYNGDPKLRNGCSIFQQFTHRSGGRGNPMSPTSRGSSYSGYFHNEHHPDLPNLRVYADSPATRIAFEGTKAIGVYFLAKSNELRLIRASKEVIIAGGAFDTPHILQVSGVGDKKHLASIGVPLVAENPAVGADLWDHISVPYVLKLKQKDPHGASTANGPFSWIMHLDTKTFDDLRMSDVQWYFMDNSPMFSSTDALCHPAPIAPADQQTSIRIIHQYPSYRGTVKAPSASIFDKPLIDLGWTYPIPPKDLLPFNRSVEVLRKMLSYPNSWSNLVESEVLPGKQDLAEYLREGMVSALHPACTCRMGTCTDGELRVRGVTNLRVCDASAFATQVDGNPAVTIFAMAEKLADMLTKQYRGAVEKKHLTLMWQQDFPAKSPSTLFDTVARFEGVGVDGKPSTVVGESRSEMDLHGYPRLNWWLKSYDSHARTYTIALDANSATALDLESATVTSSVLSAKGLTSWRLSANVVVSRTDITPVDASDKIMRLWTANFEAQLAKYSEGSMGSVRDLPSFRDAVAVPSEVQGGVRTGSAQRPFLYVMWRRNFDTVSAKDLWSSAGDWKGKLNGVPSTAPGSEHSFQLPNLPEMFETMVRYNAGSEFVYRMKRTEPPGQPGHDYISTKRVVGHGKAGSAWIRSGSLTVDPDTDPLIAGGKLLDDVYVSGGIRYNIGIGWSLRGTLLVFQPSQLAPTTTGKLAAFDLDDTLITTKSGEKFAKDSSDWKFLSDNVVPMLRTLNSQGYAISILSNQRGIGLHKVSPQTWEEKVNAIISAAGVPISAIGATANDTYAKPEAGMWDYLVANYPGKVDQANSFYSGDAAGRPGDFSDSDKKFAENAKLTFYTPEEAQAKFAPLAREWHVSQTVTLNANVKEVWEVIGGFYTIHQWHPDIIDTQRNESLQNPQFQHRACYFEGQDPTIEELISLSSSEPFSYSYRWVYGAWGERFQNYHSRILALDSEDGKSTVVQWSGSFNHNAPNDLISFYRRGLDALAQRQWSSGSAKAAPVHTSEVHVGEVHASREMEAGALRSVRPHLSAFMESVHASAAATGQLKYVVLPVGQGLGTMMLCPGTSGRNARRILFDLGNKGSTRGGLNPKAVLEWIGRYPPSVIVLSHSDSDHIKFLQDKKISDLLSKTVEVVVVSHTLQRWKEKFASVPWIIDKLVILNEKCFGNKECFPDEVPRFCDDDRFHLEVMAANMAGGEAKNPNQDSIMARITYGKFSMLLPGDFEGPDGTQEVIKQYSGGELKSQILVLAHHGAARKGEDANDWGLVQLQAPEVVLISADYHFSGFHHPWCAAVQRLLVNKLSEEPQAGEKIDKAATTVKPFSKGFPFTCYVEKTVTLETSFFPGWDEPLEDDVWYSNPKFPWSVFSTMPNGEDHYYLVVESGADGKYTVTPTVSEDGGLLA